MSVGGNGKHWGLGALLFLNAFATWAHDPTEGSDEISICNAARRLLGSSVAKTLRPTVEFLKDGSGHIVVNPNEYKATGTFLGQAEKLPDDIKNSDDWIYLRDRRGYLVVSKRLPQNPPASPAEILASHRSLYNKMVDELKARDLGEPQIDAAGEVRDFLETGIHKNKSSTFRGDEVNLASADADLRRRGYDPNPHNFRTDDYDKIPVDPAHQHEIQAAQLLIDYSKPENLPKFVKVKQELSKLYQEYRQALGQKRPGELNSAALTAFVQSQDDRSLIIANGEAILFGYMEKDSLQFAINRFGGLDGVQPHIENLQRLLSLYKKQVSLIQASQKTVEINAPALAGVDLEAVMKAQHFDTQMQMRKNFYGNFTRSQDLNLTLRDPSLFAQYLVNRKIIPDDPVSREAGATFLRMGNGSDNFKTFLNRVPADRQAEFVQRISQIIAVFKALVKAGY